jgi:hypothetical protein
MQIKSEQEKEDIQALLLDYYQKKLIRRQISFISAMRK